jgi:nitrogen fixation NifU-like protein
MNPAGAPEPQLDDLYRELILDHYRHPRNKGKLEGSTAHAEGFNPLCGDEIEVDLDVEDGVIRGMAFRGRGCSISQASASMMTEAVKGRPIADAKHLAEVFRKLMTEPEAGVDPELGDLEAFQGVAKFPVRVKCATLAWRVLEDGLNEAHAEPNHNASEVKE